MANGVGFQSYAPSGVSPQAVGAALSGGGSLAPAAGDPSEIGRTAIPGFGADSTTRRPETTTADDVFDPTVEHSPSATAAMVGLMLQRTSGGGTGAGKVQNPSTATIGQRQQWEKMGLMPAEIDMLTTMGVAKPQGGLDSAMDQAYNNYQGGEGTNQDFTYAGRSESPGGPLSEHLAPSVRPAPQDATRVARSRVPAGRVPNYGDLWMGTGPRRDGAEAGGDERSRRGR